uniref:Uncharacterized protein n=1 Tax=Oryza rufipogon TaxID=4529 RepID=A0A0E0QZ83_ORYRU
MALDLHLVCSSPCVLHITLAAGRTTRTHGGKNQRTEEEEGKEETGKADLEPLAMAAAVHPSRHDVLTAGVLHRLGSGGVLSSHPDVAPARSSLLRRCCICLTTIETFGRTHR